MEQSQWDASFGGYLEGHQTGFLGSSAQGSDGQPYHAGHAVAEQEYGNDLISPSSHAQQAAGTQVDAQDIQQYLRPRDEAPRAFLGHAGTARPPLQPNSWLHHSFPLSNNASVDLAAQGFHRQLAMQQPSPGSVSESGYGSFNARPTDFQQQPHTPLSGYGGFPTQHQPDTALYTREDPPQSVYSDLTPDRAPAKPLRTNPRTRTKVHVPPCVSCGKVLRNLSDAQWVPTYHQVTQLLTSLAVSTNISMKSPGSVRNGVAPERRGSPHLTTLSAIANQFMGRYRWLGARMAISVPRVRRRHPEPQQSFGRDAITLEPISAGNISNTMRHGSSNCTLNALRALVLG